MQQGTSHQDEEDSHGYEISGEEGAITSNLRNEATSPNPLQQQAHPY